MADSNIAEQRYHGGKHCEKCGSADVKEVRRASDHMRLVGWWCQHCRHFDKAIGREGKL